MKTIIQINNLIDKHGKTFVECPGCEVCGEIEQLREGLGGNKKDKYKHILTKGQDMKREDIKILLDNGFAKMEIARALKMDNGRFYQILENWGLSQAGRRRTK